MALLMAASVWMLLGAAVNPEKPVSFLGRVMLVNFAVGEFSFFFGSPPPEEPGPTQCHSCMAMMSCSLKSCQYWMPASTKRLSEQGGASRPPLLRHRKNRARFQRFGGNGDELMNDELKQEYIKGLLSVIDEDKKSVLLYVAFDLAVVSLTLSEKIFQSPPGNSPIVAAGLILLLISAALFFNYYRKMHLASFKLVDQILTLNTAKAKKIPGEVWDTHHMGYKIGYVVRVIALLVLIWAFVAT